MIPYPNPQQCLPADSQRRSQKIQDDFQREVVLTLKQQTAEQQLIKNKEVLLVSLKARNERVSMK